MHLNSLNLSFEQNFSLIAPPLVPTPPKKNSTWENHAAFILIAFLYRDLFCSAGSVEEGIHYSIWWAVRTQTDTPTAITRDTNNSTRAKIVW